MIYDIRLKQQPSSHMFVLKITARIDVELEVFAVLFALVPFGKRFLRFRRSERMGGCSSKPAYDTPVPAGLTHQQQLGLLIGKKQDCNIYDI